MGEHEVAGVAQSDSAPVDVEDTCPPTTDVLREGTVGSLAGHDPRIRYRLEVPPHGHATSREMDHDVEDLEA
jgi:hypothetical protein